MMSVKGKGPANVANVGRWLMGTHSGMGFNNFAIRTYNSPIIKLPHLSNGARITEPHREENNHNWSSTNARLYARTLHLMFLSSSFNPMR